MPVQLAYNTLEWGPTPNIKSMLAEIKAAGWDGWEVRQSLDWLGSAGRINDLAAEVDLPVAAVCGQRWGMSDDWPALELNKRRIEFASDVNADAFVIMAPKRPPNRTPTRDEIISFAGFAEELSAVGEDLGVPVTFHFHTGQLVQAEDEVKLTLDLAPRLQLCVDLSHAQLMEWDPIRCLREMNERVAYLHLQDYKGWRYVNLGDGDIFQSIPALFETMEEIGFEGWLTCHGGHETDQTASERAIACRKYLREIGH